MSMVLATIISRYDSKFDCNLRLDLMMLQYIVGKKAVPWNSMIPIVTEILWQAVR